ncbi:CLUMA_CG018714, isoform A [Clunio marinus]|uniref:CLUMA_CG018714, isoform A n=1 Tax=Clunio marinus TaxID=568069 RepID=A0A1J1J172_9DIPT|nr:CLUMA_CG018714, isoform A [Clunio marinus]
MKRWQAPKEVIQMHSGSAFNECENKSNDLFFFFELFVFPTLSLEYDCVCQMKSNLNHDAVKTLHEL